MFSHKKILTQTLSGTVVLIVLLCILPFGCSERASTKQEINIPEEIERCAKLIRSHPENSVENARLSYRLGFLYSLVNELDLSKNWLEGSIKLNPTPEAYAHLAEVYLMSENPNAALDAIRKGLQIGSENYRLYDRLGELYLKCSKHNMRAPKLFDDTNDLIKKALSESQRAVELNPKSADAKVQLAVLLLLENRLDEALPHLNEARKINRERGDISYVMGYVYLKKGDNKKALKVWEELLENPPYSSFLSNPLRLAKGEKPIMSGGFMGETPTLIMSLGDDGKYHKNMLLMYSKTFESQEEFTGVREIFNERFCHVLLPIDDIVKE